MVGDQIPQLMRQNHRQRSNFRDAPKGAKNLKTNRVLSSMRSDSRRCLAVSRWPRRFGSAPNRHGQADQYPVPNPGPAAISVDSDLPADSNDPPHEFDTTDGRAQRGLSAGGLAVRALERRHAARLYQRAGQRRNGQRRAAGDPSANSFYAGRKGCYRLTIAGAPAAARHPVGRRGTDNVKRSR
jgi:hypothetical protein